MFHRSLNVQLVTLTTPGHDKAEQVPVAEPNYGVERESRPCLETKLNKTKRRDRAEHEPNSDAIRRDETEPNTNPESVPEVTAGRQTLDQAEQRMPGCPEPTSSYMDTKSVRQCHTRPWPVARYVDFPITNHVEPSLITNFGKAQAEQTSRAELCCTTKKRLNEEDLQIQSLELIDCLNAKTAVNHPSLPIRKSREAQECSRRLEEPNRKENSSRMENYQKEGSQNPEKSLKTCWKEIRMSRMYLIANCSGWKELDGKHTRRLEREENKTKSELIQIKRKKFGKAGNKKITSMEEAIISSNTRKLMELEEIKINLLQKPAMPEGWKIENDGKELFGRKVERKIVEIGAAEHWQILATRWEYLDKNEHWLSASWLENSSLEEKRCILNAGEEGLEMENDNESTDMHCLERVDKKSGGTVYKLAGLFQREGKEVRRMDSGLFQRDGKEDRGMDSGRFGDTELQGQGGEGEIQVQGGVHSVLRDAEYFEKQEKKKTTTSRGEDFDLAEEPQTDRKINILCKEDIGDRPASGSVEFRRFEDTHAKKQVTSRNSGFALSRKMIEMHSPRMTSRARGLTLSEMHCQDRSPGGGGKISKFKRGTQGGTSRVKSIRKLFENASQTTTEGTIELLLEANTGAANFNFKSNFNLNPATEGSRTRQNELICVDQPGRGLQTRPREACGGTFRPGPDWPSQPGLGGTSQPEKPSQD